MSESDYEQRPHPFVGLGEYCARCDYGRNDPRHQARSEKMSGPETKFAMDSRGNQLRLGDRVRTAYDDEGVVDDIEGSEVGVDLDLGQHIDVPSRELTKMEASGAAVSYATSAKCPYCTKTVSMSQSVLGEHRAISGVCLGSGHRPGGAVMMANPYGLNPSEESQHLAEYADAIASYLNGQKVDKAAVRAYWIQGLSVQQAAEALRRSGKAMSAVLMSIAGMTPADEGIAASAADDGRRQGLSGSALVDYIEKVFLDAGEDKQLAYKWAVAYVQRGK